MFDAWCEFRSRVRRYNAAHMKVGSEYALQASLLKSIGQLLRSNHCYLRNQGTTRRDEYKLTTNVPELNLLI